MNKNNLFKYDLAGETLTGALAFGHFPVGAGLKPALVRSFYTSTFCLSRRFP
jgi:hypothetical protein